MFRRAGKRIASGNSEVTVQTRHGVHTRNRTATLLCCPYKKLDRSQNCCDWLRACTNSHIVLATIVYRLALRELDLDFHIYGTKPCLQVSCTRPSPKIAEDTPALPFFNQQRTKWISQLPKDSIAIWRWCLVQQDVTLLGLLAYLAAISINAIEANHDGDVLNRATHADALATALGMDMSRWFQPTATSSSITSLRRRSSKLSKKPAKNQARSGRR